MRYSSTRAARVAASLLLLLVTTAGAVLAEDTDEERASESGFLFRFRAPAQAEVQGDQAHGVGEAHGHGGLSESAFKAAQQDARSFWEQHQSSGAPLDQKVVIELFTRSKHFSVVHALLGDAISPSDSVRIGQLRAEIHQQVLTNLYESGRFGDRLGVNDFGTVGNAKSDIDFTPFADDAQGADLVDAYEQEFKRLTGISPGQMDIVAHKHEAFIPDWRQSRATADFVQSLRNGRQLLRANPEAYFLEGAYHQQVMGRSADGTTLMWIERDANGEVRRTPSNAASDPDFFYFRPDVRARYAWGGAVGNWHFYHAHSDDKVAQAKYLLRSMDDGARLSRLTDAQVKSFQKFEKLPANEQRRVVREIYGSRVPPEVFARFLAVMQTAAQIRDLKARGAPTGGPDAYRAMIEIERRNNPDLSDDGLLERARRSVDHYGAALLLENNIIASEARLNDWLAPRVDSGEFRTVGSRGGVRRIVIDNDKVRRLQYSAFFELRDGIELLPDAEIERIKSDNPRYAGDIDILKGVIDKQREMMLAPPDLPAEDARAYRRQAAEDLLRELNRLDAVAEQGGPARFYRELGRSAWRNGQHFEDWMQRKLVNALGRSVSGNDARMVPLLDQMRQATDNANQRFLGPRWMSRLDKSNAVVEVLKAWVREGEINETVLKTAFYQGMSYLPGVGTLMQVQGGMQGVITLTSTQLIPGYGQLLVVLQLGKNTVELAGLVVFEPLRDDRVMLAYQGYLDAGGSGLVTSGQIGRFDGRVTPILKYMDPRGALPLDERRARIYHYFHDRITAAINADDSFPFTEDEWPHEWILQEQQRLAPMIAEYVQHWWDATGPFASDDEILAFRAKTAGLDESEFRARLESRLWRDYWKGRERAMQDMIREKEAQYEQLQELMAQAAAVDVGLDRRKYALRSDFERNGEIIFAHMLDGMPVLEPELQIIAAPTMEALELTGYEEESIEVSPFVNLRAEVQASTKDHPLPWSVSWEVQQGGESKRFDWGGPGSAGTMRKDVGEDSGPWTVKVVAVARDADNREIVRRGVDLEVEKIDFGTVDEEEDEDPADDPAAVAEGDTGGDGLVPAAAAAGVGAARTAAETATQACDLAGERAAVADEGAAEIGSELDALEGDIAAAQSALASLEALVQQAEGAAAMADAAARRLAGLRDESAGLRDRLCQPGGTADTSNVSARLRGILGEADGLLDAIQDATAQARGAQAAAASAVRVDDLQARVAGVLERLDATRAAVDEAAAATAQAASAAAQVDDQVAQAAAALDEAGAGGNEEALANAEAAFGAVRAAADGVGDCVGGAQTAVDQARVTVDAARMRASGAAAELDGIAAQSGGDALDRIAQAVDEAEINASIAEAFLDSIANRVDDGTACAWNPTPAEPATPAPGDGGSGWTRSEGEGWSAGEVETVQGTPASPPQPVADPRIDGLARQAGDAFAACDYATARRLAEEIAAIAPNHPWLAANYRRILEQDRRRRGAARSLREAEAALSTSRGSIEDLRRARAAAQHAALGAPSCMVDRIDGLVRDVDEAIGDAVAAERERRRRTRREGFGALAGAIGTVLGTIAAADAISDAGGSIPSGLPTTIPGLPVPTGGSTPTGGSGGTSTGGAAAGGAGTDSYCTESEPCCDVFHPFADASIGKDVPYEYYVWEMGGGGARSYTAIALPAENSAQVRQGIQRQMQGGFMRWHGPYGSFQAAKGQASRLCPNPRELPEWAQRMRAPYMK